MNLPQCTHDHEILTAGESWKEKYHSLREDDRSMELPDEWRQEILLAIRKEKKEKALSTNSNPTWRKKIPGGHRLKFVMDSGAVKTIIPKDAVPGATRDESKGVSFRVASGNVIPNLGSTRLDGTGTLNSSPMKSRTHLAEITKQ